MVKLHVDFEKFIANYFWAILGLQNSFFGFQLENLLKAEIYQKTSTCVGSLIVIFKLQIKAKLMLVMYCEKKVCKKIGRRIFSFF